MVSTLLLFSGFLISYVKGEEHPITGALTCGGSSGEIAMDGDQDYWFVNSTISKAFNINGCGTYYNGGGANLRFDLYAYSGTGGSSVYDRELTYETYDTYGSYYYDEWSDDYDCYYYDPEIEYSDSGYAVYVLNVSEYSWWTDPTYEDSYYLNMFCDGIYVVDGTLSCDEMVEGTYWDVSAQYWFLDVTDEPDSFSVDTCGTYTDYGADTFLTLYGYESHDLRSYARADYLSDPLQMSDDDFVGACDDEAAFIHDSYIYVDEPSYPIYVVVLEDMWEDSTGMYYNMQLQCDIDSASSSAFTSSSESSMSTGMIALVIVLPLFFILAAYWLTRRKNNAPQNSMLAYPMYQAGPMQMQPMQMGTIPTGAMQPVATLPEQPAVGGGTAGAGGSAGQSAGMEGVDAAPGGTQIQDDYGSPQ